MNSEIRRFAELIAYVIVLAMLLAAGIVSLKLGTSSDIFLGGIMAGIVPTIQAIARIGQAESMNKMADGLANSQPIDRRSALDLSEGQIYAAGSTKE